MAATRNVHDPDSDWPYKWRQSDESGVNQAVHIKRKAHCSKTKDPPKQNKGKHLQN
jgi:hypothetical protein